MTTTSKEAQKTVLVTGATGQQGGAVIRHLAGKGFHLRALTRNPESTQAKALIAHGVEVVQGDLGDPVSMENALSGAWGVFAALTMAEGGVEVEAAQGTALAKLARAKGVHRYVYSSVAAANLKTGVPHFESKWQVEGAVRGLEFPSWAILRPAMFMESMASPMSLQGDKLAMPVSPTRVLQVVSVDDIGRFGARLFEKAADLNAVEVDLAGDALTMPQAAAVLSEVLGKKVNFVRQPIEEVRKFSEDMALMFEWYERVGFQIDIPALGRKYGLEPTPFVAWARKHFGPAR